MGLLKNLFTWGKARSDEAAEKVENSDPIGFAKQEIQEIEDQKNAARTNVGKMKAQILAIKRELKENQSEYDNTISKAKALKESKPELALKLAERAAETKEAIDTNEVSLKTLEGHLEKQQKNFDALEKAVKQANRDLKSMKSMDQVTKSTEALNSVDLEGSESALSKFKGRKERMKMKMDEVEAIADTKGEDLDAQADAALGKGSKGADLLASL